MTPERRAELLALLDDEQRLRSDYPKISEYLNTAPGLAGTGDIQRDAAEKVTDLGSVFDGQTDQVLLLCGPPGWGNTMASEALAAFEKAGGTRLIFIGQPQGGMTGDDAFFDALSAGWQLESQDARFVSWWNLLDVAQGWARTSP